MDRGYFYFLKVLHGINTGTYISIVLFFFKKLNFDTEFLVINSGTGS
jgi:hypothetical protein